MLQETRKWKKNGTQRIAKNINYEKKKEKNFNFWNQFSTKLFLFFQSSPQNMTPSPTNFPWDWHDSHFRLFQFLMRNDHVVEVWELILFKNDFPTVHDYFCVSSVWIFRYSIFSKIPGDWGKNQKKCLKIMVIYYWISL